MSALPLSPLEHASGVVIGAGPAVALGPPRGTPRQTLERAIAPALGREPCMVSFSGGGDSSAVLAVAVDTARKRGLALPIPVSLRFPGLPAAEETHWQELVVRHLGLTDWVRIELGGELDFLGQAARAALEECGLLWPANAHFHLPVFERAAGGSVLTGLDGDGLLGGWRWQRGQAVIKRHVKPEPRDGVRAALALAPASVRMAALVLRQPLVVSWLRPRARRRLRRRLAQELANEPRDWPARVAWYARRRYLQLGVHSLALLASRYDVDVRHPLLEPAFLSAVAADAGPAGYGTRLGASRALFGDLLPAESVERCTKAEFGAALWGPQARAFADQWDGIGVDPELVDADRLRLAWQQPNPPLFAATVLQGAWLAARARRHSSEARSR